MPLPPGWRYSLDGYADGAFELPAGQSLSFSIQSFEAPEAIAAGGLAAFVSEDDLDASGMTVSDITGNVLMLIRRATEKAPASAIWKTLDVLGARYIRVARFSLQRDPDGDVAQTPLTEIVGTVTPVINQGWFADHAVPLDRVAPTKDLKRIAPWGVIHIRVPEFWRYERAEDGRFVCDVLPEQAPPDPTLWFDYNQFSAPSNKAELDAKLRDMAAGTAEKLGPPDQVRVDHDMDGTWIESVGHGDEDGTALVFHNMHRLVAGEARVMMAHFNLLLTAEDATTSAGQDLIELMHREIHNAIVLPTRPGENPDAEA